LVGVGWWVVVGVECGAWFVHCPWWVVGACLVAVGGGERGGGVCEGGGWHLAMVWGWMELSQA